MASPAARPVEFPLLTGATGAVIGDEFDWPGGMLSLTVELGTGPFFLHYRTPAGVWIDVQPFPNVASMIGLHEPVFVPPGKIRGFTIPASVNITMWAIRGIA